MSKPRWHWPPWRWARVCRAAASLIGRCPARRTTSTPWPRRSCARPAARRQPPEAVEAVRLAYTAPIDAGLAREREAFAALNVSPEARAQRHLFFAERLARKVVDVPAGTVERPIARAGVIGAGTMGAGIATCLADAGIPVRLIEQDQSRLDAGMATIRKTYEASRDKGRLGAEEAAARIARIAGSVDMGTLADADIVIEAVFEAMDVKRQVFGRLDTICKPGTILATNTSTLDVNCIADATGRPGDVIGLHFFSPAHIMKLLEVVRGGHTAKDVIATAMALGQRLGKVAVLVGVCDGFAGNRMFINFNREAQALIEAGALPWQIDRVLTGWGLAMGPLAVMDLAGLDVGYRIRQARAPTRRPGDPYPFTTADRLAEAGRLGQKTGRGWYLYPEGTRRGVPDPEVEALIAGVSRERGITRRPVADEEILRRCLWQLVNTRLRYPARGHCPTRQRSGRDLRQWLRLSPDPGRPDVLCRTGRPRPRSGRYRAVPRRGRRLLARLSAPARGCRKGAPARPALIAGDTNAARGMSCGPFRSSSRRPGRACFPSGSRTDAANMS